MNVTCEKCGKDKRTYKYSVSIEVYDPDAPARLPRHYSVEFSTTVTERPAINAVSEFLRRYNTAVRFAFSDDEEGVIKYDFSSSNGYLNLIEVRAFFRSDWPSSIERMGQDSYAIDQETVY